MSDPEIKYVVQALGQEVEIQLLGNTKRVPLSYADGMIGAMPVFDNFENASKYSDGKYEIVPVKLKEVK